MTPPPVPSPLLQVTDDGLHCAVGGFWIDPWRPVDRAVLTHAHADHARPGSRAYLVSRAGEGVFRTRLGPDAPLDAVDWGERRTLDGVHVSLHPAGHVLGSAQVRVEYRGEVWVVTGDYKRRADPTTTPFEPQRCHTLVTESTFGLPVYRWPAPGVEEAAMADWWAGNRAAGRTSVLFGYALGKAQRLLAAVPRDAGPILVHGAVARLNEAYRAAGVDLPPTLPADREHARAHRGTALVVAPPSAGGTTWLRKVRPGLHGLRLGVDAHPGHPAAAFRRPGVRGVRPRGLGRTPGHGPGVGSRTGGGDPRVPGDPGALPAGGGGSGRLVPPHAVGGSG